MSGGVRLAAGVAAVALVMSALGISPSSADTERPGERPGVSANR
jgi:hypothetical protein